MQKRILVILFLLNLTSHSQNFEWAVRRGGSDYDYIPAIAADTAGNVIAVEHSLNNYSTLITKHNKAGIPVWTDTIAGWCNISTMTTDKYGCIFVGGSFRSATLTVGSLTLHKADDFKDDIFILKLDPAGNVIWGTQAGGNEMDFVTSLSVDQYGQTYICGSFDSETLNFENYTVTPSRFKPGKRRIYYGKLDGYGKPVWLKTNNGESLAWLSDIGIDVHGNIYISGSYQAGYFVIGDAILFNNNTFDSWAARLFLIKMDNNGNVLWHKSEGGLNSIAPHAYTVDLAGNSYVLGVFAGPMLALDTIVLFNNKGLLYGGGSQWGASFAAKYSPTGKVLWAKTADQMNNCYFLDMITDANGKLFLTGRMIDTTATSYNYNMTFVNLDNNGNTISQHNAGGCNNTGRVICTDNKGSVYIGGEFSNDSITFPAFMLANAGSGDIFIAKYSGAVVNTVADNKNINEFELNVYPNPASENIKITSEGLLFEKKKYFFFNSLGNCMMQGLLTKEENDEIDVSGLPKGVYILHVEINNRQVRKKIVVQ